MMGPNKETTPGGLARKARWQSMTVYMLLVVASVFTTTHIALTAAITVVVSLPLACWRLGSQARLDSLLIALLAGALVLLWRQSANLPQLNSDGLQGFSANDWLTPVVTYVGLGLYAAARPPVDAIHWAQARALVTLTAFAVNVITI
jgi:hypothetical protein